MEHQVVVQIQSENLQILKIEAFDGTKHKSDLIRQNNCPWKVSMRQVHNSNLIKLTKTN